MSIEFTEDTVGVWFVGMVGKDWMCGVSRAGEGRFAFKYRIRYYEHPTDPWDGKDRKSWYKGTATGTRAGMIENIRQLAAGVRVLAGGGELHECVRGEQESMDAFMDRFLAMPFVHARVGELDAFNKARGKL